MGTGVPVARDDVSTHTSAFAIKMLPFFCNSLDEFALIVHDLFTLDRFEFAEISTSEHAMDKLSHNELAVVEFGCQGTVGLLSTVV